MNTESATVRKSLVDTLLLDLVGPGRGLGDLKEVLDQAPSHWYLTGFLIPVAAGETQRGDELADEVVDAAGRRGGADDETAADQSAKRRIYFPSSVGISVLVPPGISTIEAVIQWGDYRRETAKEDGEDKKGSGTGRRRQIWIRAPREETISIPLPESGRPPVDHPVPDSGGLKIAVSARDVSPIPADPGAIPKGTRSVSVFVVNSRKPAQDDRMDEAFVFQVELSLTCSMGFVSRPNVRGLLSDEWDERVADLQFRDVLECAVGHGIATEATTTNKEGCRQVRTRWIAESDVEKVAPADIEGLERDMETLAQIESPAAMKAALAPLVPSYRAWIAEQRKLLDGLSRRRKEIAEELLRRASTAASRIEKGIQKLGEPKTLIAFRLANKVMGRAARQRFAFIYGMKPEEVDKPSWRPFQLAFLLLNVPGISDPSDPDREVVDLLFFPTGGGKTEAYLGLAAFTLVLRRLTNPGIQSAGLSVLMRYTLRLLTLDQLGRAATLICALELERLADPELLGPWPFEIGLWVGQAATPNRMGRKSDGHPNTARAKTIAFRNDSKKPAPIPLENCPWCGAKFVPDSFKLSPGEDQPNDLKIRCLNRGCKFTGRPWLPIIAVDEPIYRRLPCFLIATVDKFAALPWVGPTSKFFGKVEYYDADGFYAAWEGARGKKLEAPLPPADLVIQDELHLISGPMGTMVGLYETAIDHLSSRNGVRPKVVASTATVRRADSQILALFAHRAVDVFPPPGPDRRNSYFARTVPATEVHPRKYLGVAAQGRSMKVVLHRTYLALLGAAQKDYDAAGGDRNKNNPTDPYMTLLGYFNSLRELGGSRRIIEDEVAPRLFRYGSRKRIREEQGLFADRRIAFDVVELTSRVSTSNVSNAKRRLAIVFPEKKDRVDVAIATNMISVGLDITRLGLMVVFGQPKTHAEYIQATSRVGRDDKKPGLVVTLLNLHRPRDRSHYERFPVYHDSFYRHVEATSVTPFSPRALDRGLPGTLVAIARHSLSAMTSADGAGKILQERGNLAFVADILADRARKIVRPEEAEGVVSDVRKRAKDLLDNWEWIGNDYHHYGVQLQYGTEEGNAKPLLHGFLDPELDGLSQRHHEFRANRSMRDVEPNVNLWLRTLDDVEIEIEDDES